MVKRVCGVTFSDSKKIYYFDVLNIDLSKNDCVIAKTERGEQFGVVVTDVIDIDESKLSFSLKEIVRIATDKDVAVNANNEKDADKALKDARDIVANLDLDMKILSSSFTFDRKQLMFNFMADDRVDFRELARKLASIYKTRIELRQIGVRDKAKCVGGYGQCGKELCCASFLDNLNSVSINMAKNQNLSLSPNKINGSCGRLLCCLNYENKIYEDYRKDLPNIGDKVKYKEKKGKVISLDIINKSYVILTDDNENITIKVCDEIK